MVRGLFGLALGVALLSGVACAKKPPPPAGVVVQAVPADLPIKLDLELGGAIELLGARLEPATGLKPGSRVELTLYWRKRASLEDGFRLFTHVLDEAGERILNLDGVGLLRKPGSRGEPLYPPSDWQDGVVYVDKQAFTVPATVRTDSISVVAGLYRDEERLPVTRGRHQQDRGLVAKAAVTRALPHTVVPNLWLPRRRPAAEIVIDGKLDDGAWVTAATPGPLVNAGTGEPPSGHDVAGQVKLLFDDESLYLGFDVHDEDVRGGFDPQQRDPHLWTRDTVEVMLDPDGDGDGYDYYEIQVNPQNLVFDSQFDNYNEPKVEPNGPFGHQQWSSQVKSAVVVRGTLDDDKEDDGYVVEMAIPWASFGKAKRVPPQPADVWRMNFYVIQNNGGVAWSPILGQGNFHRAIRFGRVRFSR
jgi:hypothetical protein